MIRQVKVARDTARKGRTSVIITLKTLIVNAPAELRESLDGLTNRALTLIIQVSYTPRHITPVQPEYLGVIHRSPGR